MATIVCAYSGLAIKVEHFPMTLQERECSHPIFLLPQHKLLSYASKWSTGQLTPIDSYLLFLALLNSSELIEWRTSAHYRVGQMDAKVAANMEALIRIIGKVNLIKHPKFALPSFAITKDTCTLENVHYWIQAWHEAFLDFMKGYKEQTEQEKIVRREYALERMIRATDLKQSKKYAGALANWAELAGNFPTFAILHPIKKNPLTLAEYWKEIIVACIREEKIFQYPTKDVAELIEHCEDNIPHGSISAAALMDLIRTGRDSQSSYLCLAEFDLDAIREGRVAKEDIVETTNKLAIIQKAPMHEPARHEYSSDLEFTKAKLGWKMKQRYGDASELSMVTRERIATPTIPSVEEQVAEELNNYIEPEIDSELEDY